MRPLKAFRRFRQRERGQAALEFLAVFPVWIIVLTLFVNLLLYLGSAMILQSNVDRAAFEAAAQGGVTIGNGGVVTQLQGVSGYGVHDVVVRACYLPGAPAPGNDDGYYTQSASTFAACDNNDFTAGACAATSVSTTTGGPRCAFCPSGTIDCVPDGDYIFIEITYQQTLWLLSDHTIHREALVVSNSFQQ
jgi:Flp pilus assembly protein TadG